ncbi:integrase arm-type DNA-binding domain-containing protein [Limnohabitans sp.]|uniref:tyrosine-type recombinase/integrase n=2 Tax=Limnohabitans sp. TaxID=1907725 RepID=UPI002D1FAEA8|nr:integrase arm-type DNA-binding domain-containing protein [Limnohabitans sp.]
MTNKQHLQVSWLKLHGFLWEQLFQKHLGSRMKKSTDIRTLKNLSKPTRYGIPDTRGLHLWVRKDQSKFWIFRFTHLGKRYDMSLGSFPTIQLCEAREKTMSAKRQLLNGINPIEARRLKFEHLRQQTRKVITFRDYAIQRIEKMRPKWKGNAHEAEWRRTLEQHANPIIGNLSVDRINTDHVTKILEPIWSTKHETARRVQSRIQIVLSAAITEGLREGPNPAEWKGHLENLIPYVRRSTAHHKALAYQDVPALMALLNSKNSLTSLVLQFIILNATRSSESAFARREEIDGDVMTVAAERMKAGQPHQIPLCQRSLEIIAEARKLDPDSPYVFSKKGKCLTHTALGGLLKYLNIQATVHGFRSSFRDWVSEETAHTPEVAEMALAHTIRNKVEAAYRRGNLLQRRRVMMCEWESFCLSATRSHEVLTKRPEDVVC